MIMLRSTHEALINEKNSQLAQLQEEVRWLRHFLQPQSRVSAPIASAREADAVLEGRQDILGTDSSPEAAAIISERDRILSATY